MAKTGVMDTIHCPHCGTDVTHEEETEFGIFCPKGCGDFWKSETIPGDEIINYRYAKEYNMMLKV